MKYHPVLRRVATAAFAALLLAIPVTAAEAKPHKVSEWKLGKVLFGQKVSKGDLKGKVVVLEYWGVNCPPCIASLPHLAELEKKHRDQGLVVIGAEGQGSSKDEIKPLIEKAKVEYTITESAEGPIEVSAIPRAFVFDREGLLVYDGSPLGEGFNGAVTKALGAGAASVADKPAANTPLVATRAWTNADGKEIRAAVKAVDATTVTFVMVDGKEVKYPLEKLSADSRKTIEAAAK